MLLCPFALFTIGGVVDVDGGGVAVVVSVVYKTVKYMYEYVWLYLSVFLQVYLPTCVSVFVCPILSVSVPPPPSLLFSLSLLLSLSLSLCLFYFSLCLCLSVCLSISLSLSFSIFVSLCVCVCTFFIIKIVLSADSVLHITGTVVDHMTTFAPHCCLILQVVPLWCMQQVHECVKFVLCVVIWRKSVDCSGVTFSTPHERPTIDKIDQSFGATHPGGLLLICDPLPQIDSSEPVNYSVDLSFLKVFSLYSMVKPISWWSRWNRR